MLYSNIQSWIDSRTVSFRVCFSFIALFTLIFLLPYSVSSQGRVKVPVRIKIEDGSLDGVTVVLNNNTTGEINEVPGEKSMNLELKLNNSYLISFTKQGYITKRISFNANMPSSRSGQELYPFNFEVVLFPQYEGLNIVVFNQPVAKIFFDPLLDDFDYDTDYTKQIQSALKKAEEEIVARQKEERKIAQEKQLEQQRAQVAEQNRLRQEEDKINADKRKKDAEERKLAREQDRNSRVDQDRRSNTVQPEIGAENRSTNQTSGSETPPIEANGSGGFENRQTVNSTSGSESRGGTIGVAGDDQRIGGISVQSGTSETNSILSQGGGDESLSMKPNVDSGNDEKSLSEPVLNRGEEDLLNGSSSNGANPLPNLSTSTNANSVGSVLGLAGEIKVDEYRENGKTILRVRIFGAGFEDTYYKVVFDWGGVFYYKSVSNISQAYFYSVTGYR
ncbi:MAG: hypothetical protein ACK5C5_05645 [Bacteroidota bacterium]